ncbi:MAG: hypothetical protein ACREDK_08660 [Thermoplasmata archaeon]
MDGLREGRWWRIVSSTLVLTGVAGFLVGILGAFPVPGVVRRSVGSAASDGVTFPVVASLLLGVGAAAGIGVASIVSFRSIPSEDVEPRPTNGGGPGGTHPTAGSTT